MMGWLSLEGKLVCYAVGIYLFKVNNRNTETRREISSKLTTKKPEWRQWRCSGVFIVNLEHILDLALVFLLSPLSRLGTAHNID